MDEIKTKIDDVFEFIQKNGRTTSREVSKEFKMNRDELDKYLQVLCKSGLIKIHYSWFNTFLSAVEYDPIKLADEFKNAIESEYADSAVDFDRDAEVTDKNLKIIALKSMLMK